VSIIDRTRQTEKPQTLREQQRAFTRKRLIDTALQVFRERGYLVATVDEIATAAGASRATFYLHFKGKAELAAAVVDDMTPYVVDRYHALDELLADGRLPARAQLHDWLAQWLDVWRQSPLESQVLLQAAILEPELEAVRLRQSATFVDSLEKYFAGLPLAARAAQRDKLLLLEVTSQRILALASMSKIPVGNDQALDALTDIWMSVLARS
jgi:AcrR family transcriptional regulator